MLRLFQRLPLSRKILLGILPVFLVSLTAGVMLHNRFQEQDMMEEAQASARTYAEIIREALVTMMVNDYKVDESFMERVNRLQQFDSLHLLVHDLRLREDLPMEASERPDTPRRTSRPHDTWERDVLRTGEPVFQRTGDLFRAVIPFNATKSCRHCHNVPLGYTLGAVDLHVSFSRVAEASAETWRRSLVIFVLFTALALAVATVMFRAYVSRPVDRLVKGADAIGRGDLDTPMAGVRAAGETAASNDELRYLASRFDDMRRSLKDKIDLLDRANADLSERNRELESALTRLRRAQDELVRNERLAVIGRMTAQLSHEINNPIHNIRSLIDSSLRKIRNQPVQELLAVALDEIDRMASLTRQMLDVYRGSVTPLDRTPVDLRALVLDLVRSNEASLAAGGIRLTADVPERLPPVLGSAEKLRQVVLNLILNAKDAMPDGGSIVLHASAASDAVTLFVSDTGVGIPPEYLHRVFEAFFTTKKATSGVGLGLAVSDGIIRQHGGSIAVRSVVGQGTTFTIRLPYREQQPDKDHER